MKALMAGVVLLLAGCTSIGPTVPTRPGPGKSPEAFDADRVSCTQYADHELIPAARAFSARQSAIALGAVAVGAGAGVATHDPVVGVAGAAAGFSATVPQAQLELSLLRKSYNVYFAQCMYAHGDAVMVDAATEP